MDVAKVNYVVAATDQATAVFNSVKGAAQGLEGQVDTLKKALAGLASAFGVIAIKNYFDQIIKATAALDDMSERTGAAVENLSKFAQVAKIGGHDMGTVEQALIKLARGLAGADEETKGAGRALAFLGVAARDANGNFKDSGDMLIEIAKKLDQYKDGVGKTAIAQELFGKTGAAVLPFLKDLAEMSDIAAKATANQAAQAEMYEKAMKRLSAVTDGYIKTVLMEAIGPMTALATAFLEAKTQSDSVGKAIKDLKQNGEIATWAEDAGRAFAMLVDHLRFVVLGLKAVAATTASAFAGTGTRISAWWEGFKGNTYLRDQKNQRADALSRDASIASVDALAALDASMGEESFFEKYNRKLAAFRGLSSGSAGARLNYTSRDPKADSAAGANPYDQGVKRLQEEIIKVDDLTRSEEVLKEIQNGLYGKDLTESQKHFLIQLAAQVDLIREDARVKKEAREAQTKADAESNEKMKREAEALNARVAHYQDISDPVQKYRDQLEEIQKLVEQGRLTDEQGLRATMRINEEIKKLQDGGKKTDDLWKGLGLTFESAFEKAAVGGERLSKVLQGVAQDMAKIVFRQGVTQPLANWVLEQLGEINPFGGGKADGGPVMPGVSYLVGERGPETFVPAQSGTIVPNHAMGGDTIAVSVNINAVDAIGVSRVLSSPEAQRTIANVMARAYTRAGRPTPFVA